MEDNKMQNISRRYAKWLTKFRTKHGDKYAYPETVANVCADVPTPVICSTHGEFTQMPLNHARGAGCPKCAKEASWKSYDTWVKEFREVHGDKYEYPKQPAEVGSKVSLHITCRTHGIFKQVMDRHLQGDGCPACGNLSKRKTYTEHLADFRRVHGDKYEYPAHLPINRVGAKIKLSITCKVHGEFSQSFNSHLAGRGCPKCFNDGQTKTYQDWLQDFTKVHNGYYMYPTTVAVPITAKTKIDITCATHGDFQQSLDDHSRGKGCPKCAYERNRLALTKNHSDWLEDFQAIHGDKYAYPEEGMVGKDTKIAIVCNEHGEFTQTLASHRKGNGCPTCFSRISKANLEIAEFVETLGVAVEKEFRIVGGKRHLFVDLKAGNLGIEHDGLYWHSSKFVKGEEDLLERRESMANAGLAMFSIYGDDWLFKREVVKHLLQERLAPTITQVQSVQQSYSLTAADAQFLDETCLQGSIDGEIVRVIDDTGCVVAISVFEHKAVDAVELICYAESKKAQGGLRRCIMEYVKTHEGVSCVETFTDNRFNDDLTYVEAGFTKLYTTSPDYTYVVQSRRVHKSNFQKSRLAKMFPGEDMLLSEKEITEKHKIYRIYDCGKTKWELKL